MSEPDWSTAPVGTRYRVPNHIDMAEYQILTPAGVRFFWRGGYNLWEKGFYTSNDLELLKLIQDGLQPMEEKVAQEVFEKGDTVSFIGKVTDTTALEVFVMAPSGRGKWLYKSNLTLVEKAPKPIPDQTIVTDSHGCKFILSDKKWIRIFSVEFGKEIGEVVGYDTFAGRALQKRAREAVSV